MEDVKKLLLKKYSMSVSIVEEIQKPPIKIEKIEDYYNFFVAMLHTEDTLLQNMEHLWILGINKDGYSKCAYLVNYAKKLDFDYFPHDLYQTSVIHQCDKIVLAFYRNTREKIEMTNEDIAYATLIYHSAKLLGIRLIDYIIISSVHDKAKGNPPPPDYETLLKLDLMKDLEKDISFEPYLKFKDNIEKEKAEHGFNERELGKEEGEVIGQQKEKIEIAVNMLSKNMPLELISEITGLTADEIDKIKSGL